MVGTKPDPIHTGRGRWIDVGRPGLVSFVPSIADPAHPTSAELAAGTPVAGIVAEPVEALRSPTLPWGLRDGDMVMLADRLFSVTEPEPGRAILNPVEDIPKPIRRSWWKPSTWRRS